MTNPASILTTVNAPYGKKLSAHELVHCLLDHNAAKNVPGHMSSFFKDVSPALQTEFAEQFGISQQQLVVAAKKFSEYSGESYVLAA